MPHSSVLPLVLCDGIVQWVHQTHPAETEDVTGVWSVGRPGMVQVKCSCSSQSRSPCGPVELHPLAQRNVRSFTELEQCCSRSSNVDWKLNLLLWEEINIFNDGIIWWSKWVFWYLEVNLYLLQASLIWPHGTHPLVSFLCFNQNSSFLHGGSFFRKH